MLIGLPILIAVFGAIISTMYIVNGCTDEHTRHRPPKLPLFLRRGCSASNTERYSNSEETIIVGYMCTVLSRLVQVASSTWPWNNPADVVNEVVLDFALLLQRDGHALAVAHSSSTYAPHQNCTVALTLIGGAVLSAPTVALNAPVPQNLSAYVVGAGVCAAPVEVVVLDVFPTVAMGWSGAANTIVVMRREIANVLVSAAAVPSSPPPPLTSGLITMFAWNAGVSGMNAPPSVPFSTLPLMYTRLSQPRHVLVVVYADSPSPVALAQVATAIHMLPRDKVERVAIVVLQHKGMGLRSALVANPDFASIIASVPVVVEVFDTGGAGTDTVVTMPGASAATTSAGITQHSDYGALAYLTEALLPSKTPLVLSPGKLWVGVTSRVRVYTGTVGGILTPFTNAAEVSVAATEKGVVALLAVLQFATS